MRAVTFIFLAALPVSAMAQTPRDIAHQVWPSGAPADTSTAPFKATPFAGFNHEVGTEIWLRNNPAPVGNASDSKSGFRYAGSFMPSDLARLRGDGSFSRKGMEPGPSLAATLTAANN